MQLRLEGIAQQAGSQVHLYPMSLAPVPGAVTILLGATQAGKTSLMRVMAGLDRPSAGRVLVDDADVTGMPVRQRNVSMVYQQFINYPSLTVFDNIASPLRLRGAAEIDRHVRALAARLHIDHLLERHPAELSGGQQQRVALARALAPRPELLLLDEPFSNLDVDLRERLSLEVRAILKAQGATAILVTHDQLEAFAMADEIGVMHAGAIEQWGTAHQLYHKPATRFVGDFIGQGVLMPARVTAPGQLDCELGTLSSRDGLGLAPGVAEVDVLIRPDDILHDDASALRAQILHKAFRGAEILYTLRLASGGRVLSLAPSHHDHGIGDWIGIRVEVDDVVAFPR